MRRSPTESAGLATSQQYTFQPAFLVSGVAQFAELQDPRPGVLLLLERLADRQPPANVRHFLSGLTCSKGRRDVFFAAIRVLSRLPSLILNGGKSFSQRILRCPVRRFSALGHRINRWIHCLRPSRSSELAYSSRRTKKLEFPLRGTAFTSGCSSICCCGRTYQ